MGTSNIEESINMLKNFIYIDKGGVHLKGNNLKSIFFAYFMHFFINYKIIVAYINSKTFCFILSCNHIYHLSHF